MFLQYSSNFNCEFFADNMVNNVGRFVIYLHANVFRTISFCVCVRGGIGDTAILVTCCSLIISDDDSCSSNLQWASG